MDDEIFLGMFKDGPVDFGDIFTDQSSSPVSNSGNSSPFTDDFSGDFPTGTFFGDLEKLSDSLTIPQVKQEVSSPVYDVDVPLSPKKEEPPKKRAKLAGKKRTRTNITNSGQDTLIDKDKLLNLSSKKLEEYVQQLSRPLTTDEEKQLKRQRRLIKNRESAQLSRQKKKKYVEDLEKQVQAYSAETENLRAQVHQLTATNQNLEEHITYLESFIREQGHQVPPRNTSSFNKPAAVGICMFVVLFSFGLLFSSGSIPGAPAPLVSLPQSRVYTGRTLAQYPAIEGPKEAVAQIAAKRYDSEFDEFPDAKRQKVEALKESGQYELSNSNYWVDDEETLDYGSAISVPDAGRRVHTNSRQVTLRESQGVKTQGNNTFIYCSEAHQITTHLPPPQEQQDNPIITVLLPAAVLNGTIPYMNDLISDPENSLFEVSCQVLNITVFPYFPTVDHLVDSYQPLLST